MPTATRNRRLPQLRFVGRLLAVLGVALVGVGITALPSSAHSPGITGTAECSGLIHFQATTWKDGKTDEEKSNKHVNVQAYLGGGWVTKASGSFDASNGFQFDGTFSITPGSFPVKIRAAAADNWGDGADAGPPSAESTVTLPSNCAKDVPTANVTHDCSKWTVTLDNSKATTETTFRVNINGKDVATRTVGAGKTDQVVGDIQPGTEYDIQVFANGTLIDRTCFDTYECHPDKPVAEIKVDCDHYTVTVTNPGKDKIDFTVKQGGNVVGGGSANPNGGTGTYDSGTLNPGTYQVVVTSGSSTLVDKSVEIKGCGTTPPGTPTATVKADCDKWTVTVANTGNGAPKVPFEVTVNGVTQTVQADSTPVSVNGTTKQNAINTFEVKQNGQVIKQDTFDATKCSSTQPPKDTPKASLSVDCNGFTATFDNTASTVATTYTVTLSGTQTGTDTVVVQPKQTLPKTYPVTKGETLTISAPNLQPVSQTFTQDCASVSPPPSQPSTGGGTNSPTSTTSSTSSPTTTSSGGSTSALPSTGNNLSQMVLMAGLGLLGVGVVMMMLSRIKPQVA